MKTYEFSEKHSNTLRNLSAVMKRVGIAWIVLGILAAISTFVPSDYGFSFAGTLGGLVFAGFTFGFGALLLRPIDNLRKVADTNGNDIPEMMTAIRELSGGFRVVNISIAVGMTIYILAEIFTN